MGRKEMSTQIARRHQRDQWEYAEKVAFLQKELAYLIEQDIKTS